MIRTPIAAASVAPDFFIVGAAKAGTTTLFMHLEQHPDIFMSTPEKEPGFYCDIWGLTDPDEYAALFAGARQDQICGEASTVYLTCPASARMIYEANPEAKIIILLRNPIDRAYSLYNQMVKTGNEKLYPFARALEAEEERAKTDPTTEYVPGYHYNYLYLQSGFYSGQVKRYFDTFPRQNVHTLLFEDLAQQPAGSVRGILEFLGVDPEFSEEVGVYNAARWPHSVGLQYFIKSRLGPAMDRVHLKIGNRDFTLPYRKKIVRDLLALNLGSRKPAPLDGETRLKLLAKLRPDIERTGQLIGRDLSSWTTG